MLPLKTKTNNIALLVLLAGMSSCSNRHGAETKSAAKEMQRIKRHTAVVSGRDLAEVPETISNNGNGELSRQVLAYSEAKWSDIPVPFIAERIYANSEESTEGQGCLFCVITNRSREQMYQFYKQEMERAGWQEVAACPLSSRSIFIYDKPHKSAVITLISDTENNENKATRIECVVSLKNIPE